MSATCVHGRRWYRDCAACQDDLVVEQVRDLFYLAPQGFYRLPDRALEFDQLEALVAERDRYASIPRFEQVWDDAVGGLVLVDPNK